VGRVSKMGNRYLRKLLVVGTHAVLYNRKGHDDALRTWACKLMETKPFRLVAVASPTSWHGSHSRSCATKRHSQQSIQPCSGIKLSVALTKNRG
jgi:hypothetical protein